MTKHQRNKERRAAINRLENQKQHAGDADWDRLHTLIGQLCAEIET